MAKHGTSKDVDYDVSEGTWMNLDVSPDGKTIVFDLVGDIYTMPITGGTATLILGGAAYEMQPRFSPDGKRIAFASDRDGIMNVWTSDLTGKDLRQVTQGKRARSIQSCVDSRRPVPRQPKTLPQHALARRRRDVALSHRWRQRTQAHRSQELGAERNRADRFHRRTLRLLHRRRLARRRLPVQPRCARAGLRRAAIRSADRSIARPVIGGAGGAIRPQLSPDGKTMAFVRRVGLQERL